MKNIDDIASHIVGKRIETADVTFGEDTVTLVLSDGSVLELVVDQIYLDCPELDS